MFDFDFTRLSDEELAQLIEDARQEAADRKKAIEEQYINNFCKAFAELVQNVPLAKMPYCIGSDDRYSNDNIYDGEIDLLGVFVPWGYKDYTVDDLAKQLRGFIQEY